MSLRSQRWYISLDALKAELGITVTTKDAQLKRFIERASNFIEQRTGRVFIPETATRTFDAPMPNLPRGALYLHDDLLSVTSITDDQGALSAGDYFLYPLNRSPKRRIELNTSREFWYYDDTPQSAVVIVGQWGYCADYEDTGATLGAAISSTTTLTFTASSGTLLQTGWSLLIDSEQMFVTGISGNTITVQRGNNGTTAATHLNGAAIYRYTPPAGIEETASLLAQTWYNWRKSGGEKSERIGDYAVTYVDGQPIPLTVLAILDNEFAQPSYG